MSAPEQDSPGVGGPSIRHGGSPWAALAVCWRLEGVERVRQLLRSAVVAARGERGFVVSRLPPPQGDGAIAVRFAVESSVVGSNRPSRAIAERAIRIDRPEILLNLPRDARWSSQTSIRTLGLRMALLAPLRVAGPERAALVLDGRRAPDLDRLELTAILDAFCGMITTAWPPPIPVPTAEADLPSRIAGGDSPTFQRTLESVRRAARTRLPILILGETGTGKEALARLVHDESQRAPAPFVALNCSALPETLVEAELFGTVRGAYTGAERDRAGLFRAAHRGTLFLDEIGDMPLAAQARLLRAIQENKIRPVGATDEIDVDARVVAATHRDLRSQCAQGRFRSDLYHRLAVVEIRVPPLRERLEDLPLLVAELCTRLTEETGLPSPRLTESAWRVLRAHPWPGNIRELHSSLARGMLTAGQRPVEASDLQIDILPRTPSLDPRRLPSRGLEEQMIKEALRETDENLSKAARRIGWTRQKLYRRMQVLGIRRGQPSDG